MANAPHTPEPDWVVRDFGHSPVSVAAPGDGPCIAKVYLTEYRKRERTPELLRALRMITKAPSMVRALRRLVAFHSTGPDNEALCDAYHDECIANEIAPTGAGLLDSLTREARAILAHIDGEG